MTLLRTVLIACLMLGAATAALAFQEQRQGAPAAQAPAADFSAPSAPEAGKPALGVTEVRIPGLGKLGNLPRMDFGLELLYGAAETKPQTVTPREDLRDDDLTIRGTVRHKF